MNNTARFVLPFRWREFGSWFNKIGPVTSDNDKGRLRIADIHFAAGERKLEGLKVRVEFSITDQSLKEVFLCTFLADMMHQELFEPFIGNPERFGEDFVAGRSVILRHEGKEEVELFIPEQGWVLPSIWRFLVQSIGLRHKGAERMPDIVVFAFIPGESRPLFFASRAFDYFGNAQQLKEELILGDFFRLLNLNPEASESEIQRAYIISCRENQIEDPGKFPREAVRHRSARFSRIKQGYNVWTEIQRRKQPLF